MACADQVELVRKMRRSAVDRGKERLALTPEKAYQEREAEYEPPVYTIGRRLWRIRGL